MRDFFQGNLAYVLFLKMNKKCNKDKFSQVLYGLFFNKFIRFFLEQIRSFTL